LRLKCYYVVRSSATRFAVEMVHYYTYTFVISHLDMIDLRLGLLKNAVLFFRERALAPHRAHRRAPSLSRAEQVCCHGRCGSGYALRIMQAPPRRAAGRRRAGRPGRVVGPSLAGFLRRKSGPATGWQRGWCVLAGGQLTWFDDKGGARQFTLQLAGCACKRSQAPMASTGSELELVAPDRTYRLDAESMEHAERWLVALCEATGAGGGAGGGAAGTTAGSTATAACTATATATDVTSGLGPSSRSSDQTQAHGLPDTSVDERVLLERARYLVQRTQQAQQEEFVVDARADVFAVVVDEVALRNRPSHRGSVVVGKAVRGDRLHVQATQDAWARLDNNNWTEITNGARLHLDVGSVSCCC
jgi:hypothetical protein